MKAKIINFVWGIVLIVAGVIFLAENLGYIPEISQQVWMGIMAGLSLLFFASYFVSGIKQWGWLFPACIFGALAITLGLIDQGIESELLGIPILLGIAIPFIVGFLLDRSAWGLLIPAWVMLVLTTVLLVVDQVPGEIVGAITMFGVGLPFLVVFLANRSQWWSLIPASILIGLGLVMVLVAQTSGDFIASFIFFTIALPFFVAYLWSVNNWWAIIPGGILASIGLALLLVTGTEFGEFGSALFNGVLLLGFGITFGVMWLRRNSQPTKWAIYPAVGLLAASALAFILGTQFQTYWPVFIILGGLVVLYLAFRPVPKEKEIESQ